MNISAEREEIIRQFNMVHDIDLIKAIKSLLDFGLHKQTEDDDEALEASINRGITQCENGLGIPHEEVMADLKKRFNV